MNDKHKATCHMNSLAHMAEGKQFALTCRGCECGVSEPLPTMNEKELREAWRDYSQGEMVDPIPFMLARIKERDERLKESVRNLTPFGIGIPQDPLVSREAIISLVDNYA